jgi:L,D-peptidoglycan transpeptidase YkuD (ErfK/YbiS/YcfS/YnhG family)
LTAFLSSSGRLTFQGRTYRAAFGRGGLRAHKQEGDQATPLATLPLRRVLYRADRVARPRAVVPVEPLAPTDGWCDDPAHSDYKRIVTLPHPARHEALWRADPVYDVIGVLGWNDQPVQPGRGSAIFLHVARPDYAPTQGCVALALPDLLQLLAAGCTAIEVTAGT